jgi:hypothetical protein
MSSRLTYLFIVVVLSVGTCWSSYQQTEKPNARASTNEKGSSTIEAGVHVDSALTILDHAGFKVEGDWQWGGKDPDAKVTWRKISDGIEIAIFFSEKTQTVTMIAMMYIPPKYDHRGNYSVVPADSIDFNPDGTYVVKFAKPKPVKVR